MPLQLVIAVPTFICSLLSLLASTTFAILYILYPPERHFRQALIVNLLIAGKDWTNSLNNTLSGAIALSRRHDPEALAAGAACTVNAYVGQFSVQAIDFSILIISLSVFATVRQSRISIEPPWWQVLIVCAIPWIPPIITSNIALAYNLYGPVSGNWCWISAKYFGLRYALTHAWRIIVFVATIAIYTYIYIYLMRVYGKLSVGSSTSGGTVSRFTANEDYDMELQAGAEARNIRARSSVTVINSDNDQQPLRHAWSKHDPDAHYGMTPRETIAQVESQPSNIHTPPGHPIGTSGGSDRARRRALRKMLLLNGYPILYIILWIPGIANRIAEGIGTSPIWLKVLQASTQLVGLANAATYAYNEQLLKRIRKGKLFSRLGARENVL
ncbi:Hypothetical predicted protein [Lecanosticta acicola]|uniref:Glucose receptor Git3-like N-terminal domain-containing protein n=1 Tax=Lecanosticta acicola TaxID=111012 RepID=A0AAI9EEV2_9PEZI|nr:Hypothetical predicted protein [Lecanosticta acicola]